ncbi:hypothetical protein [Tenacibaculum amylolyticum]|uniref:hypothetical protein n=1 Tax=Tenacibaculum amylolyticum TaxID=104269 RepID=UPI0038947AAB
MPCKNSIDHAARKEFIESKVNELLKDRANGIHTVRQAYVEIAATMLFCSISTVMRALKPYKAPEKQTELFTVPTNQLTFNF